MVRAANARLVLSMWFHIMHCAAGNQANGLTAPKSTCCCCCCRCWVGQHAARPEAVLLHCTKIYQGEPWISATLPVATPALTDRNMGTSTLEFLAYTRLRRVSFMSPADSEATLTALWQVAASCSLWLLECLSCIRWIPGLSSIRTVYCKFPRSDVMSSIREDGKRTARQITYNLLVRMFRVSAVLFDKPRLQPTKKALHTSLY